MRPSVPRTVGFLSVAGMVLCLVLTTVYPSTTLAYASLFFLLLATLCYLVPGRPPRDSLVFSRTHPYFRSLEMLNLISVPITFVLVYLGIWAAMRSTPALIFLAALRVAPSYLIRRRIHETRRRLLETVPESGIDQLATSPMVKVVGYVCETRTRYRVFDYRLLNVWITDGSFQKAFLTGLTEIRRIGQYVSEGWKAYVVGPSLVGPKVRALQPVAAAVTPANWTGSCGEWFELMWKRSWRRRWILRILGSGAYLVVVLALAWIVRYVHASSDWTVPGLVLASCSSVFFGLFSHKSLVESSYYEVSNYFEPDVRRLSDAAKKHRIERLKREEEAGNVHKEYLDILRMAGLDVG